MKILFVTREGYRLPGARVRCYNFARELAGHGLRTEVLSFSDTLGARDGEDEARMGAREKIAYNWRAFERLKKEKDTVLWIQRFNYHSFAPYLAHLLNHNKIILDLDDWEMRDNPAYYLNLYPSSKAHYFTRQIARRSMVCIAASRFLRQFLLEFNARVHYIPSGVDTALFAPGPGGVQDGGKVFSWIGTFHKLEYVDNIRLAIEAFRILRKEHDHIYLDIVGDGIYRDLIVKDVRDADDRNIRLKGWIVPAQVPAYLDSIHVGLLPVARDTKFNRAKSPTKLFEYMAMAKPVVASRIGEAAAILKDGCDGFLADTVEQFAARMRELVEEEPLGRAMGQMARQTVEREYSLKVLGNKLHEILLKANG